MSFDFYKYVIAYQADRKALHVATRGTTERFATSHVKLGPVQRTRYFFANQRAFS